MASKKISELVKMRRWTWIKHVLRKDANNSCRTALTWTSEGRRKRSRPKETWRRTVERKLGFASWTETARAAQDMTNWKTRVRGPILQEEKRNSVKSTAKKCRHKEDHLSFRYRGQMYAFSTLSIKGGTSFMTHPEITALT